MQLRLLLLVILFSKSLTVWAQVPQGFKYQSAARDASGELLENKVVGLRISIRNLTSDGTKVYSETHQITTNAFGVFSLSVGSGVVVSGTFAGIDWGSGAKFLEVEADFTGGTNYTSMGISELLSVPFALYSQNGTPGPAGPKGDTGEKGDAGEKGDKGDTGEQGMQGVKGDAGEQGIQGPKGDKGDTGEQGMQGEKGDNGGTGAKGDTGDPGVAFDDMQSLNNKTWTSSKIAQELSLKANSGSLSTVASSGYYGDLLNKPAIDGSETSVTAGSHISVSGTGTSQNPYVIDVENVWSTGGNSGTTGDNFIGTTDYRSLFFKVNNQRAGMIDQTGSLGVYIGYQAGNYYTGGYNSAFGSQALFSNTNGAQNTSIGFRSLYSNTTGSDNVASGAWALYSNLSGTLNLALGNQSLYSNTTGGENVAIGHQALSSNSEGNFNTVVGVRSMTSNSTGQKNTAIGNDALYANISGERNTAIGTNALYKNLNGHHNVATGTNSLFNNTTGIRNVADGVEALFSNTTGSYNTATGYFALHQNTTGSNNTAIGYGATVGNGELTNATAIGNGAQVEASNTIQLGNSAVTEVRMGTGNSTKVITGGLQVTAGGGIGKVLVSDASGNATWQATSSAGWGLIGNNGLTDGTNFIGTIDDVPLTFRVGNEKAGRIESFSGSGGNFGNTFFGYQSGDLNTTGAGNTAVGRISLHDNTTGHSNCAVGQYALYGNTSGVANTSMGNEALSGNSTGNNNTAFGYSALFASSTGNGNVAIGYEALRYATGSNNTALGNLAGVSITGSNNIVVGYNSDVPTASASNQIRIGNTDVTYAGIQVAWTVTSDRRWKSDIQQSNLGLDFITRLRPVSYFRNNDESKKREYGFIAQELEEALFASNALATGIVSKDDQGMLSVRYNDLIAPIVNAMQEQQKMIENLRKEISELNEKNSKDQSIISKLESDNMTLKATIETRLKMLEEYITTKSRK